MAVAQKSSASKPDKIALTQVDTDAENIFEDIMDTLSGAIDDIHEYVTEVFDDDDEKAKPYL